MRKNSLKLTLFIVVLLYGANSVLCNDAKFKYNFNIVEHLKEIFYAKSDLNITKVISEFSSQNWTENHKCLTELKAIKRGISNFDDWAIAIADAWGRPPSGLLSGNFFDLGTFSQCMNIKRNGYDYKTQYCIGQLKFPSKKEIPHLDFRQLDIGPSVSLGICLPAVCSTKHLEMLINKIYRTESDSSVIEIPPNACQFEENASNLMTLDLIAIGLLGIIFAMIGMNTGYDIYCAIRNRTKYQPFLVFSAYTNGMKLFSIENFKVSNHIGCLNGIRVMTAIWIVCAHTIMFFTNIPTQNPAAMFKLVQSFRSSVLFSSTMAVDTFFTIAGLLISIYQLSYLKKNGKLNALQMYLHRFLRMMPLMIGAILISMTLLRFIGTGPLWPLAIDLLSGSCQQYWWSTFSFIQNYVNPDNLCYATTWYLSADMQLFFIAPLVVYSIHRYEMKAMVGLSALIVGCIGCTIAVHVKNNLTTLPDMDKYTKAIIPTHIRMSSWLIGIIAGHIFLQFPKGSIQIPKKFNIFAWTLSAIAMSAIKLANYPLQQIHLAYTPFYFGLYDAVCRVVWSIVLCYIIFACIHGSGGVVNWFLSHPLWQPANRLCFAIFMVHPLIMTITLGTLQSPPHINELTLFSIAVVNLVLTIFGGIIATLVFESPVINIEKLIMGSSVKIELPTMQKASKIESDSNAVKENEIEEIVRFTSPMLLEKKRS